MYQSSSKRLEVNAAALIDLARTATECQSWGEAPLPFRLQIAATRVVDSLKSKLSNLVWIAKFIILL